MFNLHIIRLKSLWHINISTCKHTKLVRLMINSCLCKHCDARATVKLPTVFIVLHAITKHTNRTVANLCTGITVQLILMARNFTSYFFSFGIMNSYFYYCNVKCGFNLFSRWSLHTLTFRCVLSR